MVEEGILYSYILIIASFFGMLYLYRKTQMQDTQPQSIFFTIDTGRTMRYLFFLSLIVAYASFVLLSFLPLVIMGIIFLVAAIFILLIDLLLVLGSLVIMLFGGDQLEIIVVSDLTNSGIFDIFFDLQDLVFTTDSIAIVLLFLVGIVVGIVLARYVEDRKSIYLIMAMHLLFSLSTLLSLTILNNLEIAELISVLLGSNSPILYIATYFVALLISSNYVFNRIHDDELFDLLIFPHFVHIILIILYIPVIAVFSFSSIVIILFADDLVPSGSTELGPLQYGLFLVSQLVLLIIILHNAYWGFRGDLPMDIKLGELEYREELLEYAREFRDLDKENIDDFVRKV